MRKNSISKTLLVLISLLMLLTLVGCTTTQEPQQQDEQPQEQEPVEQIDEVKEVIDKKVDNIDNLIKAIDYLHLAPINTEKFYSLEEATVYMMIMFGKDKDAIKANYQCPFDNVKEENKPIIAYAFANWYLSKVSDDELTNPENVDTCNNVAAVLLRFMGYKDSDYDKDFNLGNKDATDSAIYYLKSLGVEFNTESGKVRGDYLLSLVWDSLAAKCKNGKTLATKLQKAEMFTKNEYKNAKLLAKGEELPKETKKESTSTSSNETSNTGTSGGNNTPTGGGGGDTPSGGGEDTPTGGGDTPSGGGGGDNELPTVDF